MKKLFYIALICFVILGCKTTSVEENVMDEPLFLFDEEMNPEYESRTQALNTIFNPDELGKIVLVFDRSEWNKQLEYCDINIDHEENVVAKGFYFQKDNKEWFFKDIGFRIRGNTSRVRPQKYIKKGKSHINGDYVQAHFALDFEEWITEEEEEAGIEKKLAGSMKGLILKRFKDDPTYSREVYGYNLFRQNGVWIAPRASYTRLIIQIVDDIDLDQDQNFSEYETVDYGVYAMIEEIKKQFLKERSEELTENGGGELSNNKGNLWKCTWQSWGADMVFANPKTVGEEYNEPVYDSEGNIKDFEIRNYDYDYKGDNEFNEAKNQLYNFMIALNNLPNCTDGKNDEADIETIKAFYTERMDGDLFLKTIATNVILGMWDDYWGNKNNFYFYFDKKTEKAYYIPYDYDNVLGVGIVLNRRLFNGATQNPLKWDVSENDRRPLIQKILQVPEYMETYQKYLLEFSNEESAFYVENSQERIRNWQKMIEPYIKSDKIDYEESSTYDELDDFPATWGATPIYRLLSGNENTNFFMAKTASIKRAIESYTK